MVTNTGVEIEEFGGSCSLDADARAQRFTDLSEFSAAALVGRERTDNSVVLIYRDGEGVEATARRFAALEQECCPGFNIAVERRGENIVWNITLEQTSDTAMLDGIWALTEQYFESDPEAAGSSAGGCGPDCGC